MPRSNSIFILLMRLLLILDDPPDLEPVAHFDVHLADDDVGIRGHLKHRLDLALGVVQVHDRDFGLKHRVKRVHMVVHTLNGHLKRILLFLKGWESKDVTTRKWLSVVRVLSVKISVDSHHTDHLAPTSTVVKVICKSLLESVLHS